MSNRAFHKALLQLSGPAGVSALGLLLVNDHLLRRLWPSWWTGKLGDVAWLYLAPLALTAVLALLVPARYGRQERVVGLFAFSAVGVLFVLAKTVPGVHAWVVRGAETVAGFPVGLRRDPTDLLAMVVLVPGWWGWCRAEGRPARLQLTGLLALALAAGLTLGNMAAMDYGIGCLTAQDGSITASSAYSSFVSVDGGLSWRTLDASSAPNCAALTAETTMTDLEHDGTLYRFEPGQAILKSLDAGRSWQPEYLLVPVTEAERAYLGETRAGNVFVEQGPLDALVDPATGNIVLAMGFEGVLVRTAGGGWRSAAVGDYRPTRLDSLRALVALLGGELILALAFGLLFASTCLLFHRRTWWRTAGLVLGWVLWSAIVLAVRPALMHGYGEVIENPLLLALVILSLTYGLDYGIRARRDLRKTRARLGVLALGGIALFAAPYLLWARYAWFGYSTAMWLALALAAMVVLLGCWLAGNTWSAGRRQSSGLAGPG